MKKLLALVLALVMTMSLVTISNAAFKDADKISNKEAVDVMAAVGVLAGYDNGEFGATDTLTRAQACKIIAYLDLGGKTADAIKGSGTVFSDVAATAWYAGYVEYCAGAGYVAGIGGGKFDPNANVTGVQFAKMLLCALGYKAEIEGYTGSDYTIAIARDANKNDLFKGLSIATSANLTREQAAQMAFNALKADVVEYQGGTEVSTSDGTKVVINATRNNIRDNTAYDGGSDGLQQLCEKLYKSDLKVNKTTGTDDFGAPANVWTWKTSTTIGKYASEPVATFTSSTKAADVAKALGNYTLNDGTSNKKVNNVTTIASATISGVVYANSTTGTNLTVSSETLAKAIADETDNGKYVAVYADDDNKITNIVEITYTVAKVNNVTTNKNGTSYTFNQSGLNGVDYTDGTDDTIKVNGTIAKGDYVTGVKVGTVSYIYPTTSVTGTQTSKTTDNKVTISGTQYKVGTGVTSVGTFNNSDKDAVYYIDQYGFVVATTSTAASSDYVYIIGVNGKLSTTVDGQTPSVEARVLLADGTVKVVDVAIEKVKTASGSLAVGDYVVKGTTLKVFTKGSTTDAAGVTALATTAIKGKTFGYSLSSEKITLEVLADLPASGTAAAAETTYAATLSENVTKDTTKYTANGKTVLADKNTKFVVYNADKKTATVYTGAANLPTAATGTGYAVLKTNSTANSNLGTASVIFVSTATGYTADATDEYVYIDPTKYTTTLVDGETKYIYTGTKADGSEWTSAAGDQITDNAANKGLYTYDENNKVNTTAKAITTDTTIVNTYYLYDATLTVDGDLLGAGTGYYNITENTQVVYVDSDLSEVNGNGGFVVLASKDGAATSDVAAIFVTVD